MCCCVDCCPRIVVFVQVVSLPANEPYFLPLGYRPWVGMQESLSSSTYIVAGLCTRYFSQTGGLFGVLHVCILETKRTMTNRLNLRDFRPKIRGIFLAVERAPNANVFPCWKNGCSCSCGWQPTGGGEQLQLYLARGG
ncbi:unnamed protein product [Ectocarpus sp. 8 AP-2014]